MFNSELSPKSYGVGSDGRRGTGGGGGEGGEGAKPYAVIALAWAATRAVLMLH